MPLCRILYNAPYIVTPEAAIKADMIWADFLKESQHRLNSTGNNHNQSKSSENNLTFEQAKEAPLHRLQCC